jgi:YspA, cpYpsA-related SLOG family
MTTTPVPNETFVILVTGSRTWSDATRIEQELDKAISSATAGKYSRICIVHAGHETGVDELTGKIVFKRMKEEEGNNWELRVYNANWQEIGREAGQVRNYEMLRESKPHVILEFLAQQNGETLHCLRAAVELQATDSEFATRLQGRIIRITDSS